MRAFTLLCVAVLLAASSAPLPAQPAEVVCQPDYNFCVEVDGRFPADARFYRSELRGQFFIDIPDMDHGLLMDLRGKTLTSVSRDRITRDEDKLSFRNGLPADAPAYAFSIDGPIIRFEAENRKVRVLRVLDRPALVGAVGVAELLADRPEYNAGMKRYNPDPTSMKALEGYDGTLEIEVFFGTWCPHCKIYMPKILRVANDSGNDGLLFKMVGVPKGFGTEDGPWTGKKIQTIPTIIVKRNGKEITRMNTAESALPEVELAGILNSLP